jgi:peptide methionine sulfoxide reductase MsrB
LSSLSRHYAEHSGYFEKKASFVKECREADDVVNFYDSNTGKLLFTAPQERSMDEFLVESRAHGWPSFRDGEVNWENVRCLKDGETVSVDGTHLGHCLPDASGSRYCINLVSVAGRPDGTTAEL